MEIFYNTAAHELCVVLRGNHIRLDRTPLWRREWPPEKWETLASATTRLEFQVAGRFLEAPSTLRGFN